MQTFEHKYFGKVSFDANDDVEEVWEGQVDGINVTLWYDQGADVKEEDLDRFALFLENCKDHIKEATQALIENLKEDQSYMDFHLEECKDANLPDDIAEFVSKMTVIAINLWIDSDEHSITMDFMILPEESDEILCVAFDDKGEVNGVSWES